VKRTGNKPLFDFIMLSHAHGDHINGMLDIIKLYGAEKFFYSSNVNWGGHAPFFSSVSRMRANVLNKVPLDDSMPPISFGPVSIDIIWPLRRSSSSSNENNNSVVAVLNHGNNEIILSGDAEYDVWNDPGMTASLSGLSNVRIFKVPHHGADNGTIDPIGGAGTWNTLISPNAYTPFSSHIVPYGHPDLAVTNMLPNPSYRTSSDHGQNIQYISDGSNITVRMTQ